MKRKIELLAPGGDVDSIKAAIIAGANAVYCGLDKFNARNHATNITFENLQGILRLAHERHCEVFLTLNIIIVESEIPSLIGLLNKLMNTDIDGIIVQDLGVLYLLSNYFKNLKIHASTQLTTHNEGQIKFLSKLKSTRVNLSRELNIHEIKALTSVADENNMLTEVFVHGSYCISFSGICYMSSLAGGKSGNRGRCSQPCRSRYKTTAAGKNFPLNLKDNSAWFDLKEIADAGVSSIKIEGRMKGSEYVFTVINAWKKHLDSFYKSGILTDDNSDLYKVFNRDFSNGFLKGNLNKDMFIDDPMSFSTRHLSLKNKYTSHDEMMKDQVELYEQKESVRRHVSHEIGKLSIEKTPLRIAVSGKSGQPLKVFVNNHHRSFTVFSESMLETTGKLDQFQSTVIKKLSALNDAEFFIEGFNFDDLQGDVSVPFHELNSIKQKLQHFLNGSKEMISPIEISVLKRRNPTKIKPRLSVLISSQNDIQLCDKTAADIYFQIPDSFKSRSAEFEDLFKINSKLIPWFPSVLIGEDYNAAVNLLVELKPRLIVTNNSGIAYEAFSQGIPWIAGPFLNIVNSYSLLALKENFNCSGAFISNEINMEQIHKITCPEDFRLYYSIFHPILLMTSRQCLFHQVTGCEKSGMDDSCIGNCEKVSTITNLKNAIFHIEKSKGNYNRIFSETYFLNTEIVDEIQNMFSGFMIDLSDIKTETELRTDKSQIIALFENLLNFVPGSVQELHKNIYPTNNVQYKKGI